ncbi:membrane permeability protein SanA [Grimontia hollisae]|uniref:Vancomycin high temperature exclusion protein n=2 Tax=Grimontia hollisae TaxID=673 RepID=A0A377HMT6_GRIHO|nr:ElyC/SanA/YdcF family protein [Grimontia hollisae]EEY70918.1 putative SanA protein [Grimontia hollisae CIP 101886]AMG31888.1 membrane permeability protein SanA [Grimontia hollisae]MDF2186339.1 ElyC/SanA/YdcF family protein [Grimontia hollisae]STO44538.1 vancomycin high temperature exclusion protein [Grimontia hollisae]STO57414.1 vancomycin high temperature exclusion protein [Grimontia hollisae]
MSLRKAFFVIMTFVVASFIVVAAMDVWVSFQAKDRIFTRVDDTPTRHIGLVLGTSKYIGKTLNPYYTHRIDAAQDLYLNKKVDVLLLSGDNAHRSYNEPWTMKRDMLKAGIPDEKIFLDYAGFRTLDSIIRAKKVFDADEFTLVTQAFHCERALFIADFYDIDAICLAVPSPGGMAGVKIRAREALARVKAVLDIYVLKEQPKFLGPKESIPTETLSGK